MSGSILIVEDEERIAAFVEKGLRASGFDTAVAGDGAAGLDLAGSGRFDLIVLDLALPGLDGMEVLRRMRDAGVKTPVVVLTARDGVANTVAGLEEGADDYVTKPFRFEELLARIRARLRAGARAQESLEAGGMRLDLRTRRVHVGGAAAQLTAREFALAELLFRHPHEVLTRQRILDEVWGSGADPRSNIVDVYVGYLRRKLGRGAIRSERGAGYRLGAAVDGSAPVP